MTETKDIRINLAPNASLCIRVEPVEEGLLLLNVSKDSPLVSTVSAGDVIRSINGSTCAGLGVGEFVSLRERWRPMLAFEVECMIAEPGNDPVPTRAAPALAATANNQLPAGGKMLPAALWLSGLDNVQRVLELPPPQGFVGPYVFDDHAIANYVDGIHACLAPDGVMIEYGCTASDSL
jgi:hypothetical protein